MKNNKYAIETKFYDDGKIDIGDIEKVGFEQESKIEKKEKFDRYYTVFNTKEKAEIYKNACLEEKYGDKMPIKHEN